MRSRPSKWVDEYNSIYATYWGRNLTYAEVLDKESQFLLFYMLRGDIDPQMYHQANMHYGGKCITGVNVPAGGMTSLPL